ncbi:MAG TPA: DoxX family protein [Opitutaceae bacterium]|nr:DoxX family protein [Opitutaceae bacterium]
MNPNALSLRLARILAAGSSAAQSVLLLVIRLWWGWSFFLTGKGKLLHLDQTADYFASLHIPLAKPNALAAGTVECLGGLLLMLGLGSRLAAIPLTFTLAVAYATAEQDALRSIFTDPDKFTSATPFLFLFAVLVVFAFGPGKISLDELLARRGHRRGTFAGAESQVPAVAR